MERKEHRGGGSPGGGGGGRPPARAAAAASAGAPCEGEAGSVVQRTQVLLLAGEPDGDPSVLSSFAQHVLPAAGGEQARRTAAAADTPGEPSSAHQPPPPPLPSPAAPSGQLIFFLCRASSLQERAERLREVLRGVREQSRGAPAALVGVIVQPRPEEEREARGRLEELLSEVFPAAAAPGGAPVEIHTAVFSPGRPAGALQLYPVQKKRLSLQKTVSSHWLDKSMMLQILGAMLSVGTVAFGGYYFYNNPVV